MAQQDPRGLAACFDLIAMLERELRTANALRDELTELDSTTSTVSPTVRRFCRQLLDDAVEVVQATAMVQDQVCGLTSGAAAGRTGSVANQRR